MNKKIKIIVSSLLLSLMIFGLGIRPTQAAVLPVSFKKPLAIHAREAYFNGNDMAIDVSVLKPKELVELLSLSDAEIEEKYSQSMKFSAYLQIDWTLNDINEWKYTSDWDTLSSTNSSSWDYSKSIPLTSSEIQTSEVLDMRLYEDGLNQWIYNEIKQVGDNVHIDLENNDLFIRARFIMEVYYAETSSYQYIRSPLSDTVTLGASSTEVILPNTLVAPTISNLTEIAIDEIPAVEFKITSDDQVKNTALLYGIMYEGGVGSEFQISASGNDYEEVTIKDWSILSNSAQTNIPRTVITTADEVYYKILPGEVKVRARFYTYSAASSENYETIYSDWSKPVSITVQGWDSGYGDNTDEDLDITEPKEIKYTEFIWIFDASIAVIFILIIVFTRRVKCPNCSMKVSYLKRRCLFCGEDIGAQDKVVLTKEDRAKLKADRKAKVIKNKEKVASIYKKISDYSQSKLSHTEKDKLDMLKEIEEIEKIKFENIDDDLEDVGVAEENNSPKFEIVDLDLDSSADTEFTESKDDKNPQNNADESTK